MLVPHMILVDEPPIASASDVFGSTFEKVAGSEAWTGAPFSSTKSLRRRFGVLPKTSEWISPRRDRLTPEVPGAEDREERTNRPLLLVGKSGGWAPLGPVVRVGLELGAYRIGDESIEV